VIKNNESEHIVFGIKQHKNNKSEHLKHSLIAFCAVITSIMACSKNKQKGK
jgi:hypothetical protein